MQRILKFWGEMLSHGMQKKCSLTPSSIYSIPINLTLGRQPRRRLFIVPTAPRCEIWKASLRTFVRFNRSR
uniref:Uncharacterized protein n=1 Tax=Arundo donax TaxID=35708 RepID=A0A0A9FHD3_ARUDO